MLNLRISWNMSFLSSAILFCNDWTIVVRSLFNIFSKACSVLCHNWCSCKAKITFESLMWKHYINHCTKKEVFIKDFFRKWDRIRSFLQIRSHFLEIPLMENFIFCAVSILIWAGPFCSASVAILMHCITYCRKTSKKFFH